MRTPRVYQVIAGSYLNVNVFAGSVSPVKLEQLQAKLEATKVTLETADQAQIASLTREDILGDMFYAGGLGYYAQLLALSHMAGQQSGGHYQLAAGYGTVGYEPEVNSLFGNAQGIRTGGVALDIPLIYITADNDGDADKKIQFTQQTGIISSALEHLTPEQMFAPTDPNAEQPDAISAVKALQKASAAGQRVYQITQDNRFQVVPLLKHDAATLDEINSALNAGMEGWYMSSYKSNIIATTVGVSVLALIQIGTGSFTIGKVGAGIFVSRDETPGFFWGILIIYVLMGVVYVGYNFYKLRAKN